MENKSEYFGVVDGASYTKICQPVSEDNSWALASGLSPIQVNKPWYNYFIPLSSVYTLLRIIYFMLKFVVTNKDGINDQ